MKTVFTALFAGMVGFAFVQSVPAAGAATFKVLYSFCGRLNCTDGGYPLASLIAVNSTLYGTTQIGGGTGCGKVGCGTVFSLDPSTGTEKVLYSFLGGSDGQWPAAGLTPVNGTLYGTTYWGGIADCGSIGCGTVFSLDPTTGAEKVLYTFCAQQNCADGANPSASLIAVNGTLYGTTYGGGITACSSHGCGTVFSLDPSTGAEKVLYTFCAQQNCADGANPLASLIAVNGILYGTTIAGGTGCDSDGCGTVFSVDPSTGAEKVLYLFAGSTDGQLPEASLINRKGTLYGTTVWGGGGRCSTGCGTVFSLDPSTGAEKVLYSFSGGRDGRYPEANLIVVKGTLYATTSAGGGPSCNGLGCGTVFSLDPSTGAETVLHHFLGGDGFSPESSLIAVNGKLYGTTSSGGANGYGTVFVLKKVR